MRGDPKSAVVGGVGTPRDGRVVYSPHLSLGAESYPVNFNHPSWIERDVALKSGVVHRERLEGVDASALRYEERKEQAIHADVGPDVEREAARPHERREQRHRHPLV